MANYVTCGRCRWWQKIGQDARMDNNGNHSFIDYGQCRCTPPTDNYRWLHTWSDQWCGAAEPGYQEAGR
jgi:hypothetical protein